MSCVVEFEDGSCVPMIKQYLRDSKNQRNGLLVCFENDAQDSCVIGWSKCGPKDRFDIDRAHEIAIHRAFLGDSGKNVPFAILHEVFEFKARCHRYFKDKSIYVAGILPMTEDEYKKSDLYQRRVKKVNDAYPEFMKKLESKYRPVTSV